LTQVMTPHVRSIEQILEQKQAVTQEPEVYGEILSGSIAAIAFLSKGFKPPVPYGVQIVLLETLTIAAAVLETLPNNEQVRNKSFVLLQRLIQCLEDKVLPFMPQLLYTLIAHCTTEDILDVAQLFNQLCIKFKSEAISVIDTGLLPFLRKCHALIATLSTPATNSQAATEIAPHLRTEQLSIQKLTFTVLQHIVTHGATAVLLTPTNVSSLENVLQSMSDGAIHVEDAAMKKTCIIFFKEVLDQWTKEPPRNGNTDTPPATFVVQGYLRFVCDVSFCNDNFNAQDANQWRSVMEFAALLEIMKQRLVDVYYQDVLVGTLTNRLGCPAPIVEGFRNASNRKEIETCLKMLIQESSKTKG
jgi:exportin-T